MTLLIALARLLGPLLPFLATWAAAKHEARLAAKNKAQDGYIKARERIDHAEIAPDADAAREWLHRRDPKQR